jgi:hypothetical protein
MTAIVSLVFISLIYAFFTQLNYLQLVVNNILQHQI